MLRGQLQAATASYRCVRQARTNRVLNDLDDPTIPEGQQRGRRDAGIARKLLPGDRRATRQTQAALHGLQRPALGRSPLEIRLLGTGEAEVTRRRARDRLGPHPCHTLDHARPLKLCDDGRQGAVERATSSVEAQFTPLGQQVNQRALYRGKVERLGVDAVAEPQVLDTPLVHARRQKRSRRVEQWADRLLA